ncbi:hypothetical protein [Actinoallomurus acanthiterrae]
MAAFTLVATGPASFAGDGLIVRSVRATTPGLTTQIEITALSGTDIATLVARLRLSGQTEVLATVDDFELVQGAGNNGVWRSRTAVTLPEGRVAVDVEGTTVGGYHRTTTDAGVIDNGRDVTFSAFAVNPTTIDTEHEDVTITGQVIDPAAAGVPGLKISFHSPELPNNPIGSTTTDEQGLFTFTTRFTNSMHVYAVSTAGAMYRSAKSAQVMVGHVDLPTRLTIKAPVTRGIVGDTMVLTGRLERQSRSGEWAGLAGLPVLVTAHDGTGSPVRVTTGPDGTFSVPVTQYSGTQWDARFPPPGEGSRYADSGGTTAYVAAQWRTTVTGFNAAPEPVGRGATVTARGQVLRRTGDGGTEPAPYPTVALQFSPDGKTWTTKNRLAFEQDGAFTLTAKATQDGYWRAAVQDDGTYLPANSGSDYVDTKTWTRIRSFNASPEPVRKGKTITAAGYLQRYGSSWTAFSGQSVKIYFQAKGSTTWTYEGKATTSRTGYFSHGFTASKDGTWRAAYAGTSTYLAVTGSGDYVDVS